MCKISEQQKTECKASVCYKILENANASNDSRYSFMQILIVFLNNHEKHLTDDWNEIQDRIFAETYKNLYPNSDIPLKKSNEMIQDWIAERIGKKNELKIET